MLDAFLSDSNEGGVFPDFLLAGRRDTPGLRRRQVVRDEPWIGHRRLLRDHHAEDPFARPSPGERARSAAAFRWSAESDFSAAGPRRGPGWYAPVHLAESSQV